MEGLESDERAGASSGQLCPPAQAECPVPADGTVGHGLLPPRLRAQTFSGCGSIVRQWEPALSSDPLLPAVWASTVYQSHAPS